MIPTKIGIRFMENLSPKKRAILQHLASGMTNKQIAAVENTTEQVIKNYMQNMFALSGMGDRVELLIFCFRNRVIQCPCKETIGEEQMAGQAAQKSRGEVTSAMNKVDCSLQKKSGSGEDPVAHSNHYGNPTLDHNGSTLGSKNKKIKIQGYC